MNKKDIAQIRKQFKLDNDLLKIQDIFHVYMKKESGEIYHEAFQPFQMVEQEQQEMFLNHFKKVLTGPIDSKVFDLKFKRGQEEGTRFILHQGLQASSVEDWKAHMLIIVQKMFAEANYEMDTVVTFIRGEYFKPTKKRSEESEEGGNDEVYTHRFILCSVAKTDQPKKALLFDYVEKEFRSNNLLDPIINLSSPLLGFMYPSIRENASDVNHIIYSANKANQPDFHFIEKVLQCEGLVTAQEDKDHFEQILSKVMGEKVEAETIANVYEAIHTIIKDNEEESTPMLDYKDVEQILKDSGVEPVKSVELAFKDVLDNENKELKASSVLPNFTGKSIKINTKVANVAISPQDLKNIRQVTLNGKKCLLIEVDEEVSVEGFKLEVGKLA